MLEGKRHTQQDERVYQSLGFSNANSPGRKTPKKKLTREPPTGQEVIEQAKPRKFTN